MTSGTMVLDRLRAAVMAVPAAEQGEKLQEALTEEGITGTEARYYQSLVRAIASKQADDPSADQPKS